jgi:predicted HD phosphohydrolase
VELVRGAGITADQILEILRDLRGKTAGLPVDQLTHALQTATRAERAGADVDLVVGALTHDMAKLFSYANHACIAAEMMKPYLRDDVYKVMRADPMNVEQYQDEPYFETLKSFVDWDFSSFDPDFETAPLEHFEPMLREVCARPPRNR